MLNIYLVEARRQWIMFLRYPMEAFAGVVVFSIIFTALFAGSRYLAGAGADFGSRLDQVVANYVLWLVTTGLFAGPGAQLVDDSRSGILEQLFITPHNFAAFSVVRTLAGLAQHLLLIGVVLGVICLITGTRLQYRWVELIPFAFQIMAAVGVGLLVCAYAMLVKQVAAILSIGQFILIAFVATPIQALGEWGRWISLFIPINPSAQLLQRQLAGGYEANMADLMMAMVNGGLYLGIGMLLLTLAARRAKRLALIGTF